MTAFTKQEQRFLVFLVITFFLGLSVKIVRKNNAAKPDGQWSLEREQILAEFQEKSDTILRADSARDTAAEQNSITKKSLTTKININAANYDELQLLPRVGPVLAESIIHYREENGPFEKIEDIQNVTRIGPKTFEKIKSYITIE